MPRSMTAVMRSEGVSLESDGYNPEIGLSMVIASAFVADGHVIVARWGGERKKSGST